MHVAHRREAAAQVREHRRFARNAAQQQVLQTAAHDGMEHRCLAVGNGIDFNHVALGALTVVLRKLAERALLLAGVGQQPTLDDDFRLGRYANTVGQALGHRQWAAMQRAGNLQLVVVYRHDGLRGHQRERIATDHHGHFQIFILALGFLKECKCMPGQQQSTETVRPAHLQAMDGYVLHPGTRVAGDQQTSGDVGATVVFVVRRDRQLGQQIDVAVHHLLARRVVGQRPGQRLQAGVLEAGKHLAGLDAHRLGHPLPIREQAGDHRDVMPAGLQEQRSTLTVQAVGDRRDTKAQIGTRTDDAQSLGLLQMVQPAAQAGADG